MCESCGYVVDEDFSARGASGEDDHSFTDDGAFTEQDQYHETDPYELPEGYLDDAASLGSLSEDPHGDFDEISFHDGPLTRHQRSIQRIEAQLRQLDQEEDNDANPWPRSPQASDEDDYIEGAAEDEFESDFYNSGYNEAGSIDESVENNGHGRRSPMTATSMSGYNTGGENVTAIDYDTDRSNGGFSPLYRQDRSGFRQASETRSTESDNDSESSLPARGPFHVIIEDEDVESAASGDSHIPGYNEAGTFPFHNHETNLPVGSRADASPHDPIEIESDSEPVPLPHLRRREGGRHLSDPSYMSPQNEHESGPTRTTLASRNSPPHRRSGRRSTGHSSSHRPHFPSVRRSLTPDSSTSYSSARRMSSTIRDQREEAARRRATLKLQRRMAKQERRRTLREHTRSATQVMH